jgi:hypothetical protein
MKQVACVQCGKSFYGRNDKKYCSLTCKNIHSNGKRKIPLDDIQRINKILKNNYRILHKYFPGRATKIPKQQIVSDGYDFRFFTHDYTNNKGERYYYCYNLGFLSLEANQLLIVQNKIMANK